MPKRKSLITFLSLVLTLFMGLGIFTACNDSEDPPLETYSITYELNGGVNNDENPSEYTSGVGVSELKAPTKDGYYFAGWYTTSDFNLSSKIDGISTSKTGDITIYARWTISDFRIIYYLNGGVNNTQNPTEYMIGVGVSELKAPTKENYIFDGWYLTYDFTAESKVESISASIIGDIILHAKWTAKTYAIDYVLNGGRNNLDNPLSFIYGEGVNLLDPVKDNFAFAGWYLTPNFSAGTRVNNISNVTDDDVVLYAKWIDASTFADDDKIIPSLFNNGSNSLSLFANKTEDENLVLGTNNDSSFYVYNDQILKDFILTFDVFSTCVPEEISGTTLERESIRLNLLSSENEYKEDYFGAGLSFRMGYKYTNYLQDNQSRGISSNYKLSTTKTSVKIVRTASYFYIYLNDTLVWDLIQFFGQGTYFTLKLEQNVYIDNLSLTDINDTEADAFVKPSSGQSKLWFDNRTWAVNSSGNLYEDTTENGGFKEIWDDADQSVKIVPVNPYSRAYFATTYNSTSQKNYHRFDETKNFKISFDLDLSYAQSSDARIGFFMRDLGNPESQYTGLEFRTQGITKNQDDTYTINYISRRGQGSYYNWDSEGSTTGSLTLSLDFVYIYDSENQKGFMWVYVNDVLYVSKGEIDLNNGGQDTNGIDIDRRYMSIQLKSSNVNLFNPEYYAIDNFTYDLNYQGPEKDKLNDPTALLAQAPKNGVERFWFNPNVRTINTSTGAISEGVEGFSTVDNGEGGFRIKTGSYGRAFLSTTFNEADKFNYFAIDYTKDFRLAFDLHLPDKGETYSTDNRIGFFMRDYDNPDNNYTGLQFRTGAVNYYEDEDVYKMNFYARVGKGDGSSYVSLTGTHTTGLKVSLEFIYDYDVNLEKGYMYIVVNGSGYVTKQEIDLSNGGTDSHGIEVDRRYIGFQMSDQAFQLDNFSFEFDNYEFKIQNEGIGEMFTALTGGGAEVLIGATKMGYHVTGYDYAISKLNTELSDNFNLSFRFVTNTSTHDTDNIRISLFVNYVDGIDLRSSGFAINVGNTTGVYRVDKGPSNPIEMITDGNEYLISFNYENGLLTVSLNGVVVVEDLQYEGEGNYLLIQTHMNQYITDVVYEDLSV